MPFCAPLFCAPILRPYFYFLLYNMKNYYIRNITLHDIPAILEIQSMVYNVKMNEPEEVFHSFIREPRNKCFLLLEARTVIWIIYVYL